MAAHLPEAIIGTLCFSLALLPILQPFFHGVVPSAEACWIELPFPGPGFFSFGPTLENDRNFVSLYVLYSLANAISCAGVHMSCRMLYKLLRDGDYRAKRYHLYLRALVAYFVVQMVFNFAIVVAFVDNRCGYHNIDHGAGTAGSAAAIEQQPQRSLHEEGPPPFVV